jgi:hypothetical protein
MFKLQRERIILVLEIIRGNDTMAKLFHKMIHWKLIFVRIGNNSSRKRYHARAEGHPQLVENVQSKIDRAISKGKAVSKRDQNHLEKLQYKTEWLKKDFETYHKNWNRTFSDLVMDKVNIQWIIKHPWKQDFTDVPYFDRMVVFLETWMPNVINHKDQIELLKQALN